MSATQKQIGDRVRITAGQFKDQIGKLLGKEGRAWQVELDGSEKVLVPFPQVASVGEAGTCESASNNGEQVDVESGESGSEQDVEESVEASPEVASPNLNTEDDTLAEQGGGEATEHDIQPDGTIAVEFTLADVPVRGTRPTAINRQLPPAQEPSITFSDEGIATGDGSQSTNPNADPKVEGIKAKRSAKRERSTEGIDESDLTKLSVVQLQALAISKGIGIARTKNDFIQIILSLEPNTDPDRLKGQFLFDTVSRLHISRLRNKADFIKLLQA